MTTFKPGDTGRTRDGREYRVLELVDPADFLMRVAVGAKVFVYPRDGKARFAEPLDLLPPKETT